MQKHVMKLFSQPTADWFSDTFGMPTRVQEEAWAAIAKDKDVLVSAPTGTGKTLSAFLIFIDRLNALAAGGDLKEELYLLYVSPLKSLAGDIRENLRRPLDGIPKKAGQPEIVAAMRTGDTPQKERQRMIKHPPHILITTPESLYLMLTSKGGQEILRTVRAVILDELHAMIDTKRGAHLMLSIARLEKLSGRKLQRIGLSATIEPLELAAEYLSPESAVIAAPPMKKQVKIEIVGTVPFGEKRKDPLWEELAKIVTRSARILGIPIEADGALEIASRSRGTPRIANRMLRRVRDFAQVMTDGVITYQSAKIGLDRLEVDEIGLDANDRRMLNAMIRYYNGGPVGLETLAAAIGEEAVTIEDVYEPYLMQIGFLNRTPRGRCVTRAAYLHLGLTPPGEQTPQQSFFDLARAQEPKDSASKDSLDGK